METQNQIEGRGRTVDWVVPDRDEFRIWATLNRI